MAYATVAELKTYLGISGTADDALLSDLLDRATAAIEAYTGRSFSATTETRTYGVEDIDDNALLLDGWLLSVTSVTDGSGDAIPSGGYILLPRNAGRYYAVRLKSDYDWECTDEDDEVSIAGTWGWSASPPADIIHACIRLAAYYYRQKDAQTFDVTAFPEAGIITVPRGIPADVRQILDRYREVS